MNITVKDVAKHANVSPSSVSRYLNNPDSINAENAFRIRKAIDELNYVPNPMARSLKNGRSNLIGVIVPSLNSYFSLLCRAISDFFYQQGYLVFICEAGAMGEKESYYLQQMLQLSFEGILLAARSTPPEELEKIASMTKLVLVHQSVSAEIDTVTLDNKNLGEELTSHVLSLGYTNILGLFAASHGNHSLSRLEGARKAMARYPEASLTVKMDCQGSYSVSYQVIRDSLASAAPPDAIIAYGFSVSENALTALNALNLRTPGDIFMGCWGLNDFKDKYHIPIPFIEEDLYEMGITASSLLLKKIKKQDNAKKARTHIFPAVLRK